MLKRTSTAVVWIACVAAVLGLGLMAYIGYYNRYWGDDWCYNRDFKNLGAIGAVSTYFTSGDAARRGYSTNRFSLTLLSGLFYLPGVAGTQIIAPLIILLWLGALIWIFVNLSKMDGWIPWAIGFTGLAFLLYYSLYLDQHRFEILYWRSGVHYSFTLITGLYVIGLITRQMASGKEAGWMKYLAAPLAFFAGGLSETGCAYLVSAMILVLGAVWYWKRKSAGWAQRAFPTTLAAFLGLLAAMLVLIISPSNSRYDTMAVRSTSLWMVPFLSFRFSLDFILDSFKSLPVPHLIFIAFFFSLSVAASFQVEGRQSISIRAWAVWALVTAVITFLLIAAVQAPSVRFYSSPPEPRAQSLSRFTLLAGLAVIAWVGGRLLFSKWGRRALVAAALVVIGGGALYTARLITVNYAELPGAVQRAQMWDARDTAIRKAEAQGATMAAVSVIDTHDIGVQDIMRSKDMNGDWVSNCGSDYYGLQAIKAAVP